MKAPNKLKAKINMPKNIVQVFKILDLEDANNECMNAVAANRERTPEALQIRLAIRRTGR